MESPGEVLTVYAVATSAMVDALGHDRDACEAAYRRCRAVLHGRDAGAVGDALDGWRAALDDGRWPDVSTYLWQLMCSLPVGFPPDQSTLPPPAGPAPQRLRDCSEHGPVPAGAWWRFCPRCGAGLVVTTPR